MLIATPCNSKDHYEIDYTYLGDPDCIDWYLVRVESKEDNITVNIAVNVSEYYLVLGLVQDIINMQDLPLSLDNGFNVVPCKVEVTRDFS